MRRGGRGCNIKGLTKKMWDITFGFTKDNDMKKRFGMETDNIAKTIYEDVFSVPFENRSTVNYTKGMLRTYQRRLNRVRTAEQKGQLTSKFGSLFYAPSSIIKSNPQLINLMDNLHNVNLNYQGRINRHDRSFRNILDFMKKEMLISGYAKNNTMPERSVSRRLKKATSEADKLEKAIEKLSVDVYNNVPGAKASLSEALKIEDKFYREGEGKIFNQTLDMIGKTLPELHYEGIGRWFKIKDKTLGDLKKGRITREQYNSIRSKTIKPILEDKIKSEPMKNLAIEYVDLMDDMHKTLENGVNAYIKSVREGMKGKYTDDRLDTIVKKIKEKINPDKKIGYFPHYKRVLNVDFFDNLMPHMQRVSDAVSEGLSKNTMNLDRAIGELDSYVSGRTKKRAGIDLAEGVNAQQEYSRNFFPTLKRYIDEVDRFNMIAHSDFHTKESLNAAKKMFRDGTPLDGYARNTVEMMLDMNARMKGGYGFENENMEAAMKTLLSLEFTSKLGLNPRSAFKNATQGLLNIVEFGPAIIKKSRDFYNNNLELGRKVDDMMNEAGFLFADDAAPELIEGKMRGKSFTQKVRITDNETIEFKKPTFFTNLHDKMNVISGKSGIMMSKVENFNRKSTFKMAFYKMYDQLNNSTAYKADLRSKGMSESQVDAEILKRARNYGIRKTTLLHFDYSDIAKSSWLLNPAGRLLGQFQHYGIKFFEYNMGLAKQGGDDILAGELLGDRAKKLYGMGLTYFLAPAIASAATGIDFGNIIQHDAKEKVDKLWALFTGDEDDIKKEFYGKGVLTGLPFIGAPVVSDALALGNIWEFYNMDNPTMEMLLTGYEDYSLKSGDQKAYETLRLLNVASARWWYKTLPMILKAQPGAAAQYELGMYQTKESKKFKEDAQSLLPEDLSLALAKLDQHRAQAMSKKGIAQGSGRNNTRTTDESYLSGDSYLK